MSVFVTLNKKEVLILSTINKIQELLKSQGKKQKDLTDFLGVSKNSFTDWKSGRINSYMKHIPKIAEFLGVSADYLLGNDKSNTQPILTAHELQLILAYRAKPDMQAAVDRLLGVDETPNAANIGEDIAATLAAVPQVINKK